MVRSVVSRSTVGDFAKTALRQRSWIITPDTGTADGTWRTDGCPPVASAGREGPAALAAHHRGPFNRQDTDNTGIRRAAVRQAYDLKQLGAVEHLAEAAEVGRLVSKAAGP